MPRSHKKKRKAQSSSTKLPKLQLSPMSLGGADHEAFRNALLAAAKASLEDFPRILERLREIFRNRHPLSVVATAAIYGLASFIDAQGSRERSSIALQQHHVELLQAVLLTVPANEWGADPDMADAMEMIH